MQEPILEPIPTCAPAQSGVACGGKTHTKVTKVFKDLMDRRELNLFSFEPPYISFVTFVAFV